MLDQPLPLPCGATLTNRIAKAAMTEGLADARDRSTPGLNTLYRTWSEGGAGLLITGNVMIDRRFLERPGNVVIDDPGGEAQLRDWAAAGTVCGNHLWMQISHPGRQCTRASGHQPLAPSDSPLALGPMFARPRPMSEADIQDAIQRYARAAATARDCGFTGVQIHAAHGYLISQFLSPRVNQRQDDWGGDLKHRARFLLETVKAVRSQVGEAYPVGVKLNSSDFQKGGFSPEECRQVAVWLDQAGVDLLEISGGSYEQPQLLGHTGLKDSAQPPDKRQSTLAREAYFLDYAREVRRAIKMPLMVTGGFRTRAAMVAALESGDADCIGLARPLCVDADLPRALINGSVDAAQRYEDQLVLGQGWLGPASPMLLAQVINVQGEVAWFYRQIVRLSEGQHPDRKLGLLRALGQHLWNEQALARRRNRALRSADRAA